jgi:hypothetical protein
MEPPSLIRLSSLAPPVLAQSQCVVAQIVPNLQTNAYQTGYVTIRAQPQANVAIRAGGNIGASLVLIRLGAVLFVYRELVRILR